MKDSSTSPSGPKEGLKSLKEGPSGPQEGPSGPVIAQGLVFGPLSCPDIETRDCPRIHLWAFLNSAKQCIRLLVLSIYFSLSLSGAANGRTFGAADRGPFVLRPSDVVRRRLSMPNHRSPEPSRTLLTLSSDAPARNSSLEEM